MNICDHIHFKDKTKEWNLIFTNVSIPYKFQQNSSQKIAFYTNGLESYLCTYTSNNILKIHFFLQDGEIMFMFILT
jgi:hypothetical protein